MSLKMSTPVRSMKLFLSKVKCQKLSPHLSDNSSKLVPGLSSEDPVGQVKRLFSSKEGFPYPNDSSSPILQEDVRKSDSVLKPTRKRSRRSHVDTKNDEVGSNTIKKCTESSKVGNRKLGVQPEHTSSASYITREEDLAFCLVMLSRDKRWRGIYGLEETSNKGTKDKYKCEPCKKRFKSYQALGGHMASHRKVIKTEALRGCLSKNDDAGEEESDTGYSPSASADSKKKTHRCPHCSKVFPSGQALGGHKRSHPISSEEANTSNSSKDNIDLNLPPPLDDDDTFC